MIKKFFAFCIGLILTMPCAYSVTVIATVNGNPITDSDITVRTELMSKLGRTSTINRRIALQNIVDDYVKLEYAGNFNVKPTDKDADQELAKMNLGDLSETSRAMARLAIRSDIAWGVVVSKTIVPSIDVSDQDVNDERTDLIRERGLPIEITLIRLTDIPESVAKKLQKPKDCDDAMKKAEDLGGEPQKISAMQYELSSDIRERIVNLPLLTWSNVKDKSVLLVCKESKTDEYKNLDEIIKQNAIYKKASVAADQQLKQLRRKAVIIINDDKYKL